MELHEIRYFLAVCETRNFTRAAEACNVTQPALTRAIQKLEAELGGLLFTRERSNTHLTELGRVLLPHLQEVATRTEEARQSARRFLRLEEAQLRVGIMCTIGPMRFVGFLGRFRIDHPGVAVTLTEGVPARLAELLAAGELDVALMAQPDGFDERFRAEVIYGEQFVVACPYGHRFGRLNAVPFAAMDGESYLSRINCEYRDALAERLADSGAAIRRCWRSEREDWIQIMVAAGMGVCFLPEYSVTVPGLVLRPMQPPAVTRDVSLVTVAGRRWSSPLASFVQAVRRYQWRHEAVEIAEASLT
jgi:DNA-binding transcriptional LysR family regulator